MKKMTQVSIITVSILTLTTTTLWAGSVHYNTMFNSDDIAYLENQETKTVAPKKETTKKTPHFRNTMFNDDTREFLAADTDEDKAISGEQEAVFSKAPASGQGHAGRNSMFNAETAAYLNDTNSAGVTVANPISFITETVGSVFHLEPQN